MKKTFKIIGNILLWLFVVLAAFLTILVITSAGNKSGLPSLFGKMPISILSDSMKDTFQTGDLIIAQELSTADKQQLKVGEVITFFADLDGDGQANEINTHRIVKVENENGYIYFTTRGDNVQTNTKVDDQRVRYDMVIAKYTGMNIPVLGSILSYLRTQTGFLICIVAPLILFFLFELYRFIVAIVRAKGSKKLSPEEEEAIKKKAIEEYLKQKDGLEKPEDQ